MSTTLELLTEYGKYKEHKSPAGNTVFELPTCETPLTDLFSENWDDTYKKIWCGNFRNVKLVLKKTSNKIIHLYVKEPERGFTTNEKLVEQGEPWFGGPRSGEKRIYIQHPIIEEQTNWEAIILLKLLSLGLRAEVPQAIVIDKDNMKSLIVKGIYAAVAPTNFPYGQLSYDKRLACIESEGLVPVDHSASNCITDTSGFSHIIDVNRWYWPPYTNEFRKTLCDVILSEIQKQKKIGRLI